MNDDIYRRYELWSNHKIEDEDLIKELDNIKNNHIEIEDRFYKNLEFGTGGLRGLIGVGSNRINIYTIRRVSQGISNYLKSEFKNPSIAIAYDSRIKSDIFAIEASKVFASNDIKVHLFKTLMPAPALSFAVRELKCSAGVVITASHNPAKYNGYKVYGYDGCQITLKTAEEMLDEIEKVNIFQGIKCENFNDLIKDNKIEYISQNVIDKFISEVLNQSIVNDIPYKDTLKITYTPLNGAGLYSVTQVLTKSGFTDITIVPEQKDPDGNFPTCPYPNPEIKEALSLGIELSKKIKADILIATDPDCDRVGIAINHNNDYKLLSGNEVGILLFDYICKNRIKKKTIPNNPICIKTIASTDMAKQIAANYGVEVIDVLTGFKFIGEKIGELEKKGEQNRYIFGFEESYGYLSGSYVRDKDAVNASLLICEMTAYYKNQTKTLIDVLESLYKEYGYFITSLQNFTFEGIKGFENMQQIMDYFRENEINEINGLKVKEKDDYNLSIKLMEDGGQDKITLPKSNVIRYILDGDNSIIIRPSGTEPKLKIYYSTKGNSAEDATTVIKNLKIYFNQKIESI